MPRALAVAAIAVGAAIAPAHAADRARVDVECKALPEKYAYDCTFRIANARTGAPIEKAEVTIGADMPSMPMAHNVRPVKATPTATPGEYQARLGLEMYGDWAVRLRVSGAVKDQVVQMRNFDAKGSGPPSKRAAPHGGHHKH